jgi:hypothetical protein
MAKRKVKRKAPKRKRKVAKRKRKAPKRRRKRKFGMAAMAAKAKAKAKELAKKAKEAVGGAKTTFIDLGGKQILPLLVPLVDFENVKKKLKNDSQKKIANDIEGKIKTDLGAGDLDLKGTISYFKETAKGQGEEAKKKAEELKETFYTMIQEKEIYKKLEEQVNKAFEKVPAPVKMAATTLKVELNYTGFLSILKKVYTDSKDVSKKLSFNILGSLLSKTPTENDYKKNLITDIKAAGTAAIEAAKKEIDKKESTEPKKEITKEQTEQALSKSADAAAAKGKKRQEEVKKIEFKGVADFGKRKKGPSVSLKKLCKKHGVRLTVKRGKKRVYKSSKVLKEQCQRKLKRKLKKNFGRKKIKRSSIMPPKRKRKTRSKKRKSPEISSSTMTRIASAGRGQAARVKQLVKMLQKQYPNASKAVLAVLAADMLRRGYNFLAPVGYKRMLFQNPVELQSPLKKMRTPFPGLRSPVVLRSPRVPNVDLVQSPFAELDDENDSRFQNPYVGRKMPFYTEKVEEGKGPASRAPLRQIRKFLGIDKNPAQKGDSVYGKRRRRRRKFGGAHENKPNGSKCHHNYGKRRRRRRSSYNFGKKAKKPSAALRRMCKKHKVRLTLKRGGKRVYKSEAMLKKQCKKAMKRKSKK